MEQPPQSNGPPVKLVPSSATPQQPVSKPPPQEALPIPEPQQAPPVGDPQVTVRLVKPEEADVMAKQVCRALHRPISGLCCYLIAQAGH